MSIQDATFVVQRGDEQFSCLGSGLEVFMRTDSILLVQDGDTHKQFVPRTKGKKVWNTQGYFGNSSELPADHPAKNDPSWVAFKKTHDRGPGSEADFECLRNMKKGEVLCQTSGKIYIIEDSYEDTYSREPRIAHKFKDREFSGDYGQANFNFYLVENHLDILPDDALFVVTDGDNGHKSVTGAQVKALFGPRQMPWEDHDGGIFHVKNSTGRGTLTGGPFTAWDADGTNEREITYFDIGDDLVFITPPDCKQLFTSIGVKYYFGDHTDTSNVTNMQEMLSVCNSFDDDISNWDTSNVTNMNRMFQFTSKFNQDLSEWCVSRIYSEPLRFADGANRWTEPKPVWGTCPRGEDSKP